MVSLEANNHLGSTMAKTNEEYQQELAQLFVRAGEAQFMVRAVKNMVSDESDKLNNLNQKIENAQKAYRAFLAQNVPTIVPEAPQATVDNEAAKEEADATPSTEAV